MSHDALARRPDRMPMTAMTGSSSLRISGSRTAPPRRAGVVVQRPEDVGRRRAGGQPEIAVDEDEDYAARAEQEPTAERQHGREHFREADLGVPEPVRVERHGLAGAGQ